jgi:photosystem II stability/assembly factor-like uncharacterized protein
MKTTYKALLLTLLPALALVGALIVGCSGSGAVSPLSPAKANQNDAGSSADSDVIYWVNFPVTITVTDPLNDVCLINKKVGWACGNNGTILKWDGETWNRVDSGYAKTENLMAVAFVSETEGWFVGTHGTILYYNNGQWSQPDSGTMETLYSVAVTKSHTVWVVGSNGTLLKFNGISWGTLFITTPGTATASPVTMKNDLYSLALTDNNTGWVVGNLGTIIKYDGQTWTPFPGSPTTERLNSVSVVNDVQAFAVGAFGTILNFNGTTWNKMGSAFSGFDLYNIWMKDESNGWAVGQDGTLIFYDGTRWISHVKPTGKPSLNGVAFSGDLGFIVGANGTLLRFQPNGEMAKFDFLFKGELAQKPTKAKPFYTLSYTFQNQSPKTSPLTTFELPLPKGFEMVPLATPTPQTTQTFSSSQESGNFINTRPTFTPLATSTMVPSASAPGNSSPSGAVSQGAGSPGAGVTSSAPAVKKPAAVSGDWKMKDNAMDMEIGTISSSELKAVNVMIRMKKDEKPDYPVVLKALLKANDRVLSESAPLTLLTKPPKPLVEDEGNTVTAQASPNPVTKIQPKPTFVKTATSSTPAMNVQPQSTPVTNAQSDPTANANAQPGLTEEP